MARGDFDTVIVGAVNDYGREIRTYDDGYGPIWGFYDSMGLLGLVRARSFEEAWSICEDEMFPEAQETVAELISEYGEEWDNDPCFQECYGFRPNGRNEYDTIGHGIYERDINGERMVKLDRESLRAQGIKLDVRRS